MMALTNKAMITNLGLITHCGAAMVDRSRAERLQIMLSPEELVVLDDFRFKKRMPSRAAAVRELLKRGLAAEGFAEAAFGAKSSDYGITGTNPTGRQEVDELATATQGQKRPASGRGTHRP
jgi:hypothetical protein